MRQPQPRVCSNSKVKSLEFHWFQIGVGRYGGFGRGYIWVDCTDSNKRMVKENKPKSSVMKYVLLVAPVVVVMFQVAE